jgi:hypothetical protein
MTFNFTRTAGKHIKATKERERRGRAEKKLTIWNPHL